MLPLERLMVREGWPYVIASLIPASIFAFTQYWFAAVPFTAIALFMAYFFRDPERIIPTVPGVIVAPADGRITRIESDSNGKLVSIFLSPLDVHINRAPISGTITDIQYTSGKKIPATRNEASLVNERNTLTIENGEVKIVCTQIAGILARRIVCWKKKGDQVARGERFGMIKFSSRTDLLLPQNAEFLVELDQKIKGGETIIARLESK